MVIGIVGQNIENHPAEHLLTVGFGQMQFTANGYQLLIAICIRTDGSQRLGVYLPFTVTIETLGDEMIVAVNGIYFRRHHTDSCHRSQFIVGHLQFSRTVLRIAELQQTVVIVLQAGYLTTTNLTRLSVDGNDGLRLTATCRCADSQQ